MLKVLDIGILFQNPVHEVLVDGSYTLVQYDKGDIDMALQECDLLMFGGGADIHPSLYNQQNVASQCGMAPSYRDNYEQAVFTRNQKFHKKPVVGICRGAQFVCAMSGGSLIQHIDNHALGSGHPATIVDGAREIYLNSYHHQMMWPYTIRNEGLYKVLVKAKQAQNSSKQVDARGFATKEFELLATEEPEIVYFKNTRSLGIQCHPEWMSYKDDGEALDYIRSLINMTISGEL